MKKLLLVFLCLNLSTLAKFTSEDELSIIVQKGNSDKETYDFSSKNAYTWTKNIIKLEGGLSFGKSDNVKDVNEWNATLRYERILTEKFDAFASANVESNQFKGFWTRFNYDLGGVYSIIKSEKLNSKVELGYRYTKENPVDNGAEITESKLRAYFDISGQIRKGSKWNYWIEFIPSLEDSDNYIVNFEPSVQSALSSLFSLKVAYLWQYENKPAIGVGKHDTKFTTSLLANF